MLRNLIANTAVFLSRPNTFKQYQLLKKVQYMDSEAIKQLKLNSLRNILEYAKKNCPYYSKHIPFFDTNSLNFDKVSQIPLLTKETLRANFDSLLSKEISTLKAKENRSGGSTGVPTKHMQSEHFRQMDMANNLLFKSWGNSSIGDRSLFIAADERDYFGHHEGLRKRLIDFIFNKSYYNAFKLTDVAFDEIVNLINNQRPDYIQIYTSVAQELSRHILRNKINLHSPKMIMCIAGSTPDDILNTISEAFRCKVLSRYGSRETGDMAGMCINRIYHEMSLTHHLEVTDEQGKLLPPGSPGNIVVTSLTNQALPLIRYKIGDIGIINENECSCGVKFPSLKKIVGRSGEIFKNSKGKIIPPEIFIHLVGVALGKVSDEILRYQIIQKSFSEIEVKVVKRDKNSNAINNHLDALEKSIIQIMEEPVSVKVIYPDEIPKLPSGKYSYTLSELAN